MLARLYRKYVSDDLRLKVYDLFLGQLITNYQMAPCLFKGICIYLFSPFFPKDEYHNAYRFIGKHGATYFPFEASLKYKKLPVTVSYDGSLPYIEHHGKRLYFPSQMPKGGIVNAYRSLLIEQDIESAHRYVRSYDELKGKTLLDIGSAEGIFTLDVIEYVDKVYLFECEEKWIESLQATFRPWKEKVEIVRKYVGDNDSEGCTTLDIFMQGKEQNNIHIKMDIEGAEQSALQGADKLLTNGKSISFSICTYHRKEDAETISNFFASHGYVYEFSPGYLYFSSMRKAICRGRN
jgi:hypothetical protein